MVYSRPELTISFSDAPCVENSQYRSTDKYPTMLENYTKKNTIFSKIRFVNKRVKTLVDQ